ncbi:hypothetical protein F5148DRAFT_1161431 [Russula earlei]|uniref:Uncharacterized protein n=1 Tax=Russula earlei TaxID=71964 RepID=A0ACC0UPI2_9AGAM|nr:hypothetical protein F5148DRAFT_1161431 [Russula earlei]
MMHALPRCTRLGWQQMWIQRAPRLLPQLIRQFASLLHAPRLSSDGSASNKPQKSRIYRIITPTRCLLKQEKNDEAVKFFKRHVSFIPSEDYTTQLGVYERGISAFIKHKRFNDALELYRQMVADGIFASSGIRAKMLVCSSINNAPHEQEELESLFDKLSDILTVRTYSERSLRQLLPVMENHPLIDSYFVSRLVDRFVDSRPSGYELGLETVNKLIRFYVHIGSIDTAERLVLSQRDSSHRQNPGPYTTLISECTKRDSLLSQRLDSLLVNMKQSQVLVDLLLLNALVRWSVRTKDLHRAFALYQMILLQDTSDMIPDTFAFGSLFNALQYIRDLRNASIRQGRLLPDFPTLRQLFRQMLDCYVLAAKVADPRPVVRVSTLNVALRQFMRTKDHPAAFVALRVFPKLGLTPDARTYRLVFAALLANLRSRLKRARLGHQRDALWVDHFFGVPGTAADMRPEDVGADVALALREFAVADGAFRAPPLDDIMSERRRGGGGEVEVEWGAKPLERLVGKAILADMGMGSRMASEGWVERALRAKTSPYFYEMVPDRLLRGRRLRRATRG